MAAAPSVEPSLPAWWLEEALTLEGDPTPAAALAGDARADVAIVGGGYTGLWTALALRERAPHREIVLLEAEVCGAGPSGRNGGFLHGYWASLARTRRVLGEGRALELARLGERIVPAVRVFAAQAGADVWLREGGMLMVATTEAQEQAVQRAVEAAIAVDAPEQAVALSRAELAERVRSPVFRSGVWFPDCATVHPARLVRALRRAAIEAGVRLYEGTPATHVADGSVRTVAGAVRARDVVLAVNAGLAARHGVGRQLTNFGSYVVMTEPVPELLAAVGWTGGEAIVDGRMFLHYFRTLPDGRVLMGSGSGPVGLGGRLDGRFSRDRPTAARAEAGLRRLLPGLASARVERAWGGPIDVSADHLPFFGTEPGTRIHYGAGYSGHGVGPSWLGGQALASLVLGADDEWTRSPLVGRRVPRLPPEPLRRLGGGLVRWGIMRCEAADEAGRPAPVSARAVAALPGVLGMELGTR
jgi:glycine/D-amino acid oxidase-like deaminating enzyme